MDGGGGRVNRPGYSARHPLTTAIRRAGVFDRYLELGAGTCPVVAQSGELL
jgi:hypothetical protein